MNSCSIPREEVIPGGVSSLVRKLDTSSGYETDVEVNLWSGPPRNRRRRDRTQFKQRHLARLEEVFTNDRYPDIHTREELADEMGVTEDRIQVWFQNRRSKLRRRLLNKPAPLTLSRRDVPSDQMTSLISPVATNEHNSHPMALHYNRSHEFGLWHHQSLPFEMPTPSFTSPTHQTDGAMWDMLPQMSPPVVSKSTNNFVPHRPWETVSPKKPTVLANSVRKDMELYQPRHSSLDLQLSYRGLFSPCPPPTSHGLPSSWHPSPFISQLF